MTRLKALSLCAAVVAGVAARANAATIVYQNTTTQVGGFVFNGAATVGTDLATNIDINKLTMTPGSTGDTITSLSFQVFNNNNAAVGVRPIMYLWANNGAGGLPGMWVASLIFPPPSGPPQLPLTFWRPALP